MVCSELTPAARTGKLVVIEACIRNEAQAAQSSTEVGTGVRPWVEGGAVLQEYGAGLGRHCSPRHIIPYNSRKESSQRVGRRGEQYLAGPSLGFVSDPEGIKGMFLYP